MQTPKSLSFCTTHYIYSIIPQNYLAWNTFLNMCQCPLTYGFIWGPCSLPLVVLLSISYWMVLQALPLPKSLLSPYIPSSEAIHAHVDPVCCLWAWAGGRIQVDASSGHLMQVSPGECRPGLEVVIRPSRWLPIVFRATCNGSCLLGLHPPAAGTWLQDPVPLLKLSAVGTSAWNMDFKNGSETPPEFQGGKNFVRLREEEKQVDIQL